jgi:hypothetical protein
LAGAAAAFFPAGALLAAGGFFAVGALLAVVDGVDPTSMAGRT